MLFSGAYKELTLAASVVNYLKMVNNESNRKDISLDKSFMKALLIGLWTVKTIKNEPAINSDLKKCVKRKQYSVPI